MTAGLQLENQGRQKMPVELLVHQEEESLEEAALKKMKADQVKDQRQVYQVPCLEGLPFVEVQQEVLKTWGQLLEEVALA